MARNSDPDAHLDGRHGVVTLAAGLATVGGAALTVLALPDDYRVWGVVTTGVVLFAVGAVVLVTTLRPPPGNIGSGINPRVRWFDVRVRSALAFTLVFGTLTIVAVGLIRGTPTNELGGYLAPISGLAGLAVGYYFGRGQETQ